jgi:hypothetical protein
MAPAIQAHVEVIDDDGEEALAVRHDLVRATRLCIMSIGNVR